MSWRRAVLFVCWLAAGFWGIYYLVTMATTSLGFIAYAAVHFIVGYFWARAIMERPLQAISALAGIVGAGAFTRLAVGSGTSELYFAPLGVLAAIALADVTTTRTLVTSLLAYALGALAFLWLTP